MRTEELLLWCDVAVIAPVPVHLVKDFTKRSWLTILQDPIWVDDCARCTFGKRAEIKAKKNLSLLLRCSYIKCWCILWTYGIIGPYFFKDDAG